MVDRLSLSFPREPDSVPAARAALDRFEGRLSQSTLYDASLCLSELVTNAVQHPAPESGSELGLELSLSDEALRVEVIDPGGDFRPSTPTHGDERGWGLFIVDQLSTRWGTEPGERRTVMWFEIHWQEEQLSGTEPQSGEEAASKPRDPGGDEIVRSLGRARLQPALV